MKGVKIMSENLTKAFFDLQEELIIQFWNDEEQKWGVVCWMNWFSPYIHWRNYGSSANENTIDELKWIAETIGGSYTYKYRIVDSIWGDEILDDIDHNKIFYNMES